MIDRSQVLKMAKLSKLEISEEEISNHQETLGRILDYIKTLDEVDTEGVKPTIHPISLQMNLRPDVVADVLTKQEVLRNAPADQDGKFVVPKMIGDS